MAARTLLTRPVFKAILTDENLTVYACALHGVADKILANLTDEDVNRLDVGCGLNVFVEILSVSLSND